MALAFIALSSSHAYAAESAFDLVCKGKSGQQLQFRFDLAQKKWCIENCQSVWAISTLDDALIELVMYSSDGSNDNNWTIKINRYTGTFAAIRRGYGSKPKDTGNCIAKPFSGFPGKKF